MDDYAADVLALMAHLEIEDAVIADRRSAAMSRSRSSGGHRSAWPGWCSSTRAPAPTATRRKPIVSDCSISLARDGVPGVARDMLPKLLGETTRREQPDLVEALGRLIEANSTEAIVAAIGALRDRPDSPPLLATIQCPTVIVAGDEDAAIPVQRSRGHARRDPSVRHCSCCRRSGTCRTWRGRACFPQFCPCGGQASRPGTDKGKTVENRPVPYAAAAH